MGKKNVLKIVEAQLANWIPKKYGVKRGPYKELLRLYNLLTRSLCGIRRWDSNFVNTELGVDEFGRSIFRGMQLYVELLQKRNIKLNAVIVQGSRVKRKWKPSSDIDVTIIAEGFKKGRIYPWPLNKIVGLKKSFLLSDIPLCLGVEPSFIRDKQEFFEMLKNFNIHALDTMYYGKVIYDDGFWNEAKDLFNEINEKNKLYETDLKQKLFIL